MEPVAFIGRLSEHFSRLPDVVLLKPRFGERATDLEMFVAGESRLLQRANEQGRRFRAVPLLEGFGRAVEQLWQHREEYTRYTGP